MKQEIFALFYLTTVIIAIGFVIYGNNLVSFQMLYVGLGFGTISVTGFIVNLFFTEKEVELIRVEVKNK